MTKKEKILLDAKKILRENWVNLGKKGGYTKPSSSIYPFQWSWDSGFVAYGYAHYDIPKAISELEALFKGQWSNGFLPHIIFHKKFKKYFPNYDFWNAQKIAPEARDVAVPTSGLTQPPLHAMAVWHIFKELKKKNEEKAVSFIKKFYPKLFQLHKYLHEYRDPEKWGLITIYHPWESGFDNSPRWDKPLNKIRIGKIPRYERYDTKVAEPKHRPTKENYDKYIYLVLELKKRKYNSNAINKDYPFKIKDEVFSSILYLANKRLKKLADVLGEDTKKIDIWMKRFEKNFIKKLWNKNDKLFYDYDVCRKKQIRSKTVAALMPVITGLLKKRRLKDVNNHLASADFCGERKSCAIKLTPSMGLSEKQFNPELYWRGPIWININWFLWKGFREYGMLDRANHFRSNILKLVGKEGFWEHYSPLSGKGTGASNFSWSASLVIDLIYRHRLDIFH